MGTAEIKTINDEGCRMINKTMGGQPLKEIPPGLRNITSRFL